MFVLAEVLRSLAYLFDMLFTIAYWLLVVRILLSWFSVDPEANYNDVLRALYQLTEPILAPFRKLPLRIGFLDLSPIVAFLVLNFVHRLVVRLLTEAAFRVG